MSESSPDEAPVAAGGLVYSYDSAGHLRLVLINDKHGNWGLPKGHLEDGETSEQAARREIEEETGLYCTLGPLIERVAYQVNKRGEWRTKTVDYFLAATPYIPTSTAPEEGITEVVWLEPDAALPLISYEQVRQVCRKGLAMLRREA